jgi:hypothetical protein
MASRAVTRTVAYHKTGAGSAISGGSGEHRAFKWRGRKDARPHNLRRGQPPRNFICRSERSLRSERRQLLRACRACVKFQKIRSIIGADNLLIGSLVESAAGIFAYDSSANLQQQTSSQYFVYDTVANQLYYDADADGQGAIELVGTFNNVDIAASQILYNMPA